MHVLEGESSFFQDFLLISCMVRWDWWMYIVVQTHISFLYPRSQQEVREKFRRSPYGEGSLVLWRRRTLCRSNMQCSPGARQLRLLSSSAAHGESHQRRFSRSGMEAWVGLAAYSSYEEEAETRDRKIRRV